MASLRVHVLQHSELAPPGTVLDWLKARGHAATLVRLYGGDSLPTAVETDWLIVLGGEMNVDDTAQFPFLVEEKKLLREAIAAKKTCLGLCLGGQLLAQSLGAAVKKNPDWEVGWHTVHFGGGVGNGPGHSAAAGPDSRLMVFQWHQDTFDLPADGVRVATNRVTENQGFMFGDRVVGLQFHPEVNEEWVKAKVEKTDPMPEGAHVQTKEQILEGVIFATPLRKWFYDLLGRLETITAGAAKRT